MYQPCIRHGVLARGPANVLPSIVLVLILLLLMGCGETSSLASPLPADTLQTVPVRAAVVELRSNDETLRFASVVRARQRANLTFQVAGVLAERHTEIGQQVKAGDVLATLYNPQLAPARDAAQARLQQLKGDAAQAGRDLQRFEQLHARGVAPLSDLEQQRSRLESLEAAIANAAATLEQSDRLSREGFLRAPFAGSVEAVLVEPGEFVQPGQPVLRVAAHEGLEAEVRVPAQMLAGLREGESIPVWSSLTGQQGEGLITEIARSSSGDTALYSVVISLSAPELRAGDAVEAGIRRQRAAQLFIPVTSVMRAPSGLAVFRLSSAHSGQEGGSPRSVMRVPVQVEQLQGEYAVIAAGTLQAGDAVVYAGLSRLAEGDLVEVLQ